jgi:hypothetical protein
MRRFFAWLGCLLGAAWIFRWFRRAPSPEPAAADPAEELRRKLEASREDEPAQPPAEETPEEGLDERRRAVHDRARAAIDAMRVRPDDAGDS